MSIKTELQSLIQSKKQLTYYELEAWCRNRYCKSETATRALRDLTTTEHGNIPLVRAIENEKGAIVRYEWIGASNESKMLSSPCPVNCFWYARFSECNCPRSQIGQVREAQLF